MSTRIIADTPVWIEFFRDEKSLISSHLQGLLRSGRVALTGMVLAEILQGVKGSREAALVSRSMEPLFFMETNREAWQMAGDMSAALRRKGLTIPLSDILIASVALNNDCEVFTTDPHFDSLPGLRLHKPA
ncbi:MAG: PIN domain-containing protein [Desulfobacterales bacterium]|nr:PIN domain-containing protein [Desulfobacterales bacterium]